MDVSYDSTAYHQSVRGDDMEGMLREAFNIQSHGLQSFPPDFLPSDDCNLGGNAGAQPGRSVHHEEPNGEAGKDDIDDRTQTLPFPEQNLNENIPDKMPRRKVRSHRIVQGTPNSAKTNSTEQQTAIGFSNIPVTPEEPIEVQNETGGTRRGRERTDTWAF
ncbi:hypothetical protein GOBAR_DD18194 [Gossypium barbadense]|nr:hypothetical protein GOBAR_DD18194 [Gossypium barbadense]